VSTPHLPPSSALPPKPRGVIPLGWDLGVAGGHRLLLLALERWDGWADLRFARLDLGSGRRLTRRVPPADAWTVHADDLEVQVFDAVGRGDRWFSNGEVRLVPPPPPRARLRVAVRLASDLPPLSVEVPLPG